MEEDERKRKILAGKDKLAAFRKKRATKRRKKPPGGELAEGANAGFSDASSVADGSDIGFTSDSDAASVSSEMSTEDEDECTTSSASFVRAKSNLKKAKQKVAALEETLIGKQSVVDSLAEENQQLKSQLQAGKTSSVMETPGEVAKLDTPDQEEINQLSTVDEFKKKVLEFRDALVQRDAVIKQLSDNLQATRENRDSLQSEYMAQAEQLAQQVQILQLQLKQAGEWLHKEMGVHGISAQALLEAKNELLALQESHKQKDRQILLLQSSVQERDAALTQLVDKYKQNAKEFERVQAENSSLRDRLEEAAGQLLEHQQHIPDLEVLKEENRLLKEKEKQTSQVVRQLMADVESAQKGGAARIQLNAEGMMSAEEHGQKMAALRAELDETYGQQIVEMKQHLQEHHLQEMESRDAVSREEHARLCREISELRALLDTERSTAPDLDTDLQQLRTEKAAYVEHIQKLTAHIQAMGQERELLVREFQSSRARNEELEAMVSKSQKNVFDITEQLQRAASEKCDLMAKVEQLQTKLSISKPDSRTASVPEGELLERHKSFSSGMPALDTVDDGPGLLYAELQEKLSEAEAEIVTLHSQISNRASQELPSLPLSAEIEEITTRHQQEIKSLKQEHSKLVESLQEEFMRTLQMSTVHHTQAFGNLQEKLQLDYESTAAAQTAQQSDLLSSLQSSHQKSLQNAAKEALEQSDRCAKLEQELAIRGQREEGYTLEIARLKAELLELQSKPAVGPLPQDQEAPADRCLDVSQPSSQMDVLDTDFEKVNEEVQVLRQEQAQALHKLAAAISERDQLRSEFDTTVDSLEARYGDASQQLECLNQEKTTILQELKETVSEKALLQTRYEEELSQLKDQYKEVTAEIETLREERTQTLAQLEKVMESSREVTDGQSSELDQLSSEHAQVVAELEKLKAEKEELDHRFEALLAENKLEGAVAERELLARKCEELLVGKTQWEHMEGELTEKLNALLIEKGELQHLTELLSEKRTSLETEREMLTQKNGASQSLEAEKHELTGQTEQLQSQKQECEAELKSHMQWLQSQKQEHVVELKARMKQLQSEKQECELELKLQIEQLQSEKQDFEAGLKLQIEQLQFEKQECEVGLKSQIEQLQSLQQECEVRLKSQIEQLQSEKQESEAGLKLQIEQLQFEKRECEVGLKSQIEQLQSQQQECEVRLKSQIEQLQSEKQESEAELTSQIEQLQSQKQKQEMELKSQMEQLQCQKHEHETELKTQMEQLHLDLETQVADMKSRLSTATEDMQQEKSEKDQYILELEADLEKSKSQYVSELALLKEERESLMDKTKNQYETDIVQSQEQHDQETKKMRSHHDHEMAVLKASHEAQLLEATSTLEEVIVGLKDDHNREMETLQEQHQNILAHLKQEHAAENEKLKCDLSEMQAEFEGVLDISRAEFAEKMEKVRGEITEKEEEVRELLAERQSLQDNLEQSFSELEQKAECLAELEQIKVELETRLHQGVHECDQHRNIIETLAADKVDLEAQVAALRVEKDDQMQDLHNVQADHGKVKQLLEQASQTVESLLAEKEVLQHSLQTMNADKESLAETHANNLEKLKESHSEVVAAVTGELETLKQSCVSAQEDHEARVATLQEELKECSDKTRLFKEEKESEVENLHQELQSVHARLNSATEEIGSLKQDNVELVNDLKKEHAETLNQLCDEVRVLKEERDELLAEKSTLQELLESQIKALGAENADLSAQNEALAADLAASDRKHEENKIALLSETGSHFDEQCAELRQKILCLEEEREKLEKDSKQRLAEREDLADQLLSMRSSLARQEAEKSALESTHERVMTEMRAQVDQLTRERKSLQQELEVHAAQAGKQEKALQEAQAQVSEATAEKEQLCEQLRNQDKTMEETMAVVDGLKTRHGEMQEERDLLSQENQKLADWINTEHEAAMERLHTENTSLQEQRDIMKGEHTRLIEDMRSEHMVAVQQLTEQIQAVTLSRDSLGADYEEKLQQQGQGFRGTIHELEGKIQEMQSSASDSEGRLLQSVREMEEQLSLSVSDRDEAESRLKSLTAQLEHAAVDSTRKQQEFDQEVKILKQHLENVQQQQSLLQSSTTRQIASEAHTDGAAEAVQEELQVLREERDLLRIAADHYEKEIAGMQQQLSKYKEDNERAMADFEQEMLRMKTKMETAVEERNAMKTSYETDMANLSQQVSEKETANEILEKQIMRLTTEMGAVSKGRIPPDGVDHDVANTVTAAQPLVADPAETENPEVQAAIQKYTEKMERLKEQHQTEMKVLEYNLTETHMLEIQQQRAHVEAELESSISQRKEDLENEYQHRLEALTAQKEHEFVENLQNMKKAFEDQEKGRVQAAVHEAHRSYEEGMLHQISLDESQQMQTMVVQIDKLQKENQELAEARDAFLQQIDSLLASKEEVHLAQQDNSMTLQLADLEQSQDWSAPHGLAEPPRLRKPSSTMEDSLEEDDDAFENDMHHEVHELRKENELLKARIEDAHLQAQETWQEEWLSMQAKCDSVIRQNESLVQQLHLAGITPSRTLSANHDSASKDSLEPEGVFQAEYGFGVIRKDSLDEEFIDWKLKYEVLQEENHTLRTRLRHFHSPSPRLSPIAMSPTHKQSFDVMQQRYGNIAAENEILRAKLGRLGLPTEGAPEDDFVNIPGQFELMVEENKTLQAKLDAYESGRLDPLPNQEVGWKAKYETVLKEYENLKTSMDQSGVFLEPGAHLLDASVQYNIDELESQYNELVRENQTLREEQQAGERAGAARYAELERNHSALHGECDELHAQLEQAMLTQSASSPDGPDEVLREENKHLKQQLAAVAVDHQEQYTAVQNKCEELKAQLAAAQSTMSQTPPGDMLTSSQSNLCDASMMEEYAKLQKQHAQLAREHEEKHAVLQEECDDLKAQLGNSKDKAKKDYTRLKAKLLSATKENDKLKGAVKKLEAESAARSAGSEKTSVSEECSVQTLLETSSVTSHPDSSSAIIAELNAENGDLVKELNDLREQLTAVQVQSAEAIKVEAELENLKDIHTTLLKDYNFLQKKSDVPGQVSGASGISEEVDCKTEPRQEELQSLKAHLLEKEQEVAGHNARTAELECKHEALMEENYRLKAHVLVTGVVNNVISQHEAAVCNSYPSDLEAQYRALLLEHETLKQQMATDGSSGMEAKYQALCSEHEQLKQQMTASRDAMKVEARHEASPAGHEQLQQQVTSGYKSEVEARYQALLTKYEQLKQQVTRCGDPAAVEAKYLTLLSEYEQLKQEVRDFAQGDLQHHTTDAPLTSEDSRVQASEVETLAPQALVHVHEELEIVTTTEVDDTEDGQYMQKLESKNKALTEEIQTLIADKLEGLGSPTASSDCEAYVFSSAPKDNSTDHVEKVETVTTGRVAIRVSSSFRVPSDADPAGEVEAKNDAVLKDLETPKEVSVHKFISPDAVTTSSSLEQISVPSDLHSDSHETGHYAALLVKYEAVLEELNSLKASALHSHPDMTDGELCAAVTYQSAGFSQFVPKREESMLGQEDAEHHLNDQQKHIKEPEGSSAAHVAMIQAQNDEQADSCPFGDAEQSIQQLQHKYDSLVTEHEALKLQHVSSSWLSVETPGPRVVYQEAGSQTELQELQKGYTEELEARSESLAEAAGSVRSEHAVGESTEQDWEQLAELQAEQERMRSENEELHQLLTNSAAAAEELTYLRDAQHFLQEENAAQKSNNIPEKLCERQQTYIQQLEVKYNSLVKDAESLRSECTVSKVMQQELENLVREHASLQLELKEQKLCFQRKLEEMQTECDKAKTENKNLRESLENSDQASQGLAQLREKHLALQEENATLKSQYETENISQQPQDYVQQLEANYQALVTDAESLRSDCAVNRNAQHELENLVREHTQLKHELEEGKKWFELQLQDSQTEYEKLRRENKDLHQSLDSSDAAVQELMQLKENQHAMQEENATLKSENEYEKLQRLTAQNTLLELKTKCERFEKEKQELEEQLHNSTVSERQLRCRVKDVEVENSQLRAPASSMVESQPDVHGSTSVGISSSLGHPEESSLHAYSETMPAHLGVVDVHEIIAVIPCESKPVSDEAAGVDNGRPFAETKQAPMARVDLEPQCGAPPEFHSVVKGDTDIKAGPDRSSAGKGMISVSSQDGAGQVTVSLDAYNKLLEEINDLRSDNNRLMGITECRGGNALPASSAESEPPHYHGQDESNANKVENFKDVEETYTKGRQDVSEQVTPDEHQKAVSKSKHEMNTARKAKQEKVKKEKHLTPVRQVPKSGSVEKMSSTRDLSNKPGSPSHGKSSLQRSEAKRSSAVRDLTLNTATSSPRTVQSRKGKERSHEGVARSANVDLVHDAAHAKSQLNLKPKSPSSAEVEELYRLNAELRQENQHLSEQLAYQESQSHKEKEELKAKLQGPRASDLFREGVDEQTLAVAVCTPGSQRSVDTVPKYSAPDTPQTRAVNTSKMPGNTPQRKRPAATKASPKVNRETAKQRAANIEKDVKQLKQQVSDLANQLQVKERENTDLLNLMRQSGRTSLGEDLAQMKIQYEILLVEKNEICSQFEEDKKQLEEEVTELRERNQLLEKQSKTVCEQVSLIDVNGLGMMGQPAMESADSVHGDVYHQANSNAAEQLQRQNDEMRDLYQATQQEDKDREVQLQMMNEEKKQVYAQLDSERQEVSEQCRDADNRYDNLLVEYTNLRSQYQLLLIDKDELSSELEHVQRSVLHGRLDGSGKVSNQGSAIGQVECGSQTDGQQVGEQPSIAAPHMTEFPHSPIQQPRPSFATPWNPGLAAGMTFSELQVQYEILLQEKREVCLKLEAEETKVAELKKSVADVKADHASKLHNTDAVKFETDSLRIQYEILMEEKKDVCEQLNQYLVKTSECEKAVKTASDKVQELEKERALINREKVHLQKEKELLLEEKQRLSSRLEGRTAKLKDADMENSEVKKRSSEIVVGLQVENEKLSQDVELLTIERNSLLTDVKHCQEELASLKEELEFTCRELETTVETLQGENNTLKQECEDLKQQLDRQKAMDESELREALEDCMSGRKELLLKVQEHESRCEELTEENEELRKSLQEKSGSTSKEIEDLQAALEECLIGKERLFKVVQSQKYATCPDVDSQASTADDTDASDPTAEPKTDVEVEVQGKSNDSGQGIIGNDTVAPNFVEETKSETEGEIQVKPAVFDRKECVEEIVLLESQGQTETCLVSQTDDSRADPVASITTLDTSNAANITELNTSNYVSITRLDTSDVCLLDHLKFAQDTVMLTSDGTDFSEVEVLQAALKKTQQHHEAEVNELCQMIKRLKKEVDRLSGYQVNSGVLATSCPRKEDISDLKNERFTGCSCPVETAKGGFKDWDELQQVNEHLVDSNEKEQGRREMCSLLQKKCTNLENELEQSVAEHKRILHMWQQKAEQLSSEKEALSLEHQVLEQRNTELEAKLYGLSSHCEDVEDPVHRFPVMEKSYMEITGQYQDLLIAHSDLGAQLVQMDEKNVREMTELLSKIEAADLEKTRLEVTNDELEHKCSELMAEINNSQSKITGLQQEQELAELEKQKLKEDCAQIERNMQEVLNENKQQMQVLEAQVQQMTADCAEKDLENQTLLDKCDEIEKAAEELVREKAKETKSWETKVAEIGQEKEDISRERAALEQVNRDLEVQMMHKEAKLASVMAELIEVTTEKDVKEDEKQELRDTYLESEQRLLDIITDKEHHTVAAEQEAQELHMMVQDLAQQNKDLKQELGNVKQQQEAEAGRALEQITQLRRDCEEKECQNGELVKKCSSLEDIVRHLTEQLSCLQQKQVEMCNIEEEKKAKETENEDIQKKCKELEEVLGKEREELMRLSSAHDRDLGEKEEVERKAEDLLIKLHAITSEHNIAQLRCEEEASALKDRVKELEQKCDSLTQKCKEADTRFITLSSTHHSLKSEYQCVVEETAQVIAEKEGQLVELRKWAKEVECEKANELDLLSKEHASVVEDKNNTVARQEGEIHSMGDRISRMGQEKREVEALLRTAHSDLAFMRAKYEMLEQALRDASANGESRELDIKQELIQVREKYETAVRDCNTLGSKITDLQEMLAMQAEKVTTTEASAAEIAHNFGKVQLQLIVAERNLQERDAQCQEMEETIEGLSAKLAGATDDLQGTVIQLATKEKEVNTLEEDIQALSGDHCNVKQALEDLSAERSLLRETVATLEARLADKDSATAVLQSQCEEKDKELCMTRIKCQLLEETLETEKGKLSGCEEELKGELLELGQARERIATQNQKLIDLEAELEKSSEEMKTLREDLCHLEKGESIVKVRLEEKEEYMGALEKDVSELKMLLAAEREKAVESRRQVDDMTTQIAGIQTQLRSEQETTKQMQQLLDEKSREKEEVFYQLRLAMTRNEDLDGKLQEAAKEMRTCDGKCSELESNMERTLKNLQRLELELEEQKSELESKLEECGELRGLAEEKEIQVHNLEVNFEEKEQLIKELHQAEESARENYQQAIEDLNSLRKSHKDLKKKWEEAQQMVVCAEAKSADKVDHIGRLQDEVAALKADRDAADEIVSKLKDQLQRKTTECEVLEENVASGEASAKLSLSRIAELDRLLAEVESGKHENEQEMLIVRERCSELQEDVKKKEEEREDLQKLVAATGQKLESVEKLLADADSKQKETLDTIKELQEGLQMEKCKGEKESGCLKSQLNQAKEEKGKLLSELDVLSTTKAKAEGEVDLLETKCLELENLVCKKEQHFQEMCEDYKSRCQSLEERRDSLTQFAECLNTELEKKTAVISELTQKWELVNNEKEQTVSELERLEALLEISKASCLALKSEMELLQQRCTSLEEEQLGVDEARNQQLQLKIDHLTDECRELKEELEKLSTEQSTLQQNCQQLEEERTEQQGALRSVSEAMSGLKRRCTTLEEEKAEMSKHLLELETELGCLQAEKLVLQGQLKKLEEYLKAWILNNCGPSDDSMSEFFATPESQEDPDEIHISGDHPAAVSTPMEKESDVSILESYFVLCAKHRALEEQLVSFNSKHEALKEEHANCPKVDDTEVNLPELQEENAQLFKKKTELEDELMSVLADKADLETKLQEQRDEADKETSSLEQKLGDFQSLLDTVTIAKEKLQEELMAQRQEYEDSLTKARMDALQEQVQDKTKREQIVDQVTAAERKASEMKDRLRLEQEDKELLRLKAAHLTRECKLYERHVKDLENEVEQQQQQIQEATYEHKETIKMLAEMRMEQEMSRCEQRGEFTRLESEIHKLEWQMNSSTCSTPHALSVASAPVDIARIQTLNQSNASQPDRSLDLFDLGPYRSALGPKEDGHKALELKHFQMVDELTQLNRELRETKDKYSKETRLLRNALEKEKKLKARLEEDRNRMSESSRTGTGGHLSRASSMSSIEQCSLYDFPTEMLCLRDRMAAVQASNLKLISEREALRKQLGKQEEIVKELEAQAADESLLRQIELLQEERDELARQLDQYRRLEEQFAALKAEKMTLTEKLKKEQELHREKSQQKEQLEVTLLRERLVLERQMREQHKLEDLFHRKEVVEEKIMKHEQETQMEDAPVGKATQPLCSERQRLEEEKGKLELEISRKVNYRDEAIQVGLSGLPIDFRKRKLIGFGTKFPQRLLKLDCGCAVEEGTSLIHAECRYHKAVEHIRAELKKQPLMTHRKHRAKYRESK